MGEAKLKHKQRVFCHEYIVHEFNGTAAALIAFDIKGKEILENDLPELEYYKDERGKKKVEQESLDAQNEWRKEVKRVENVAAVMANENLRKPKIIKEIARLLDRAGFNEESVRIEHAKVIKGSDHNTKMRGIAEFYKLKGSYQPEEIRHTIITEEEVKDKIKNLKT